MKKKCLLAALMYSVCMAVSCAAPAALAAEEETVAETEESGMEEVSEAESGAGEELTDAEDGSETEPQTEFTVPERPDYRASEYVTLGDYKGLELAAEPVEVSEDQIDEEILQELQYSDQMETVTEGAVQNGDIANIDYEGKKDGVAFEGGTAEGYDLEIGSHSFISGFEEGLIGVEIGSTVDLPLTFPENYFNEDLAGADVVFTVTVNEVSRVPELTDEIAAAVTDGEYSDVASWRESVRSKLLEYAEQQREENIRADILTQVANVCEIKEYPQELIDYNIASMEAYYRSVAEMYSMEFEDFLSAFLNMTYDEFKEESVLACQEVAQQELYLNAIAEAENIVLDEEDFVAGTQQLAQKYGYETAEELLNTNDEKELRLSLLQDKVFDFLIENAVIVEPETETETDGLSDAETAAGMEMPQTEEAIAETAEGQEEE